jgi:hypothetical protein
MGHTFFLLGFAYESSLVPAKQAEAYWLWISTEETWHILCDRIVRFRNGLPRLDLLAVRC